MQEDGTMGFQQSNNTKIMRFSIKQLADLLRIFVVVVAWAVFLYSSFGSWFAFGPNARAREFRFFCLFVHSIFHYVKCLHLLCCLSAISRNAAFQNYLLLLLILLSAALVAHTARSAHDAAINLPIYSQHNHEQISRLCCFFPFALRFFSSLRIIVNAFCSFFSSIGFSICACILCVWCRDFYAIALPLNIFYVYASVQYYKTSTVKVFFLLPFLRISSLFARILYYTTDKQQFIEQTHHTASACRWKKTILAFSKAQNDHHLTHNLIVCTAVFFCALPERKTVYLAAANAT